MVIFTHDIVQEIYKINESCRQTECGPTSR